MTFTAENVLGAVVFGFLLLWIATLSLENAKRYDDRGARIVGFIANTIAMFVLAGAVYMAFNLGHP
jgi:hypothetical protein